jgi:hypothetical protein
MSSVYRLIYDQKEDGHETNPLRIGLIISLMIVAATFGLGMMFVD